MKDASNDFIPLQDSTIIKANEETLKSSELIKSKGLLVILSYNYFGNSFVIDKNMTIGRQESCDIVINDALISKKHCTVEVDEAGSFFIKDLGSTNSTFLNRKKVSSRKQLFYGDRIIMGNTIFRFLLEEKLD
jgi:hypothetical protein